MTLWLACEAVSVSADALLTPALSAFAVDVDWDTTPRMPDFGFGFSQNPDEDPIGRFIQYAQGVIVVVGIIGVLYSAGKMAAGRIGRSEVAAEGVGGLVWTIMGVSLMLVAISVATGLAGVG
ncbi:hypothetical protein [Streptomonospora litoralis]|uniref:Uncharacterized protein n=1 Tax=Streptomonospora litoralis TaxID=2498135 RepID=A0A4P6Q6N6_9ACTN|nr:hypothetical protein [Streptomonospora litoralis]QBI56343.1 hypothetical protein EKD16_22950 [Streptomonospora litoralis]